MYLFSGLQLFAFVTYLYLGIYIWAINPRERLNRACVCTIACMAIWSLQDMVVFFPGSAYQVTRISINIGALGWIGLPVALLWFIHIFTKQRQRLRTIWYHSLTTAPFLFLYGIQWQWLIIDDIHPVSYGWNHSFAPSVWTLLFCIYYAVLISWSLFLLVRFIRNAQRQVLKTLATMILAIAGVCFLIGSITNILLPIYQPNAFPPIASLVTLIWAAGLTYAMVRYKFLTISPAIAAPNILATMSDLLILCDPQGNIVTVNAAACELLGYPSKHLVSRPFDQFIFEDQLADKQHFLESFGKETIKNCQLNLKTQQGNIVPVILSCSLLADGRGELAGTVTVAKDISALSKAEFALRSSQERYRDLVENLNDIIYSLNGQCVVTYVSPRVKSVFGFLPTELIGQDIQQFVPKDDRKRVAERLGEVLQGGQGASNFRLIKKDSTIAWVRASARPIRQSGKIIGLRGVITDVTKQVATMEEMRQLEARLHHAQKMEAIGTLAGGVAHDLNNILSGIVSYPDLLLIDLPPESDLRTPLELIKSSGLKAATIVQDMLTLARRGVADYQVVNLNHIINDFLQSPEHKKMHSHYPQIALELQLADALANINGSTVHLYKTVMNLLSNAFDATSGQGLVTLGTSNREVDANLAERHEVEPGTYCLLSVSDDGVGIAPEDLDRIFEPFYTKKVMGRSGTGLGMAVVWGTVNDHNGFIELFSQPGQGTRLDLYFPATQEKLVAQESPLPADVYHGRQETILVVDDVADQRTIATAILKRLGYRVKSAASGELAVKAVQEEPADLLILDMIMDPGMDGLETYKAILANHPRQKAVIASGYSETEGVKEALNLGASQYIKKPYTLENIGVAVRTALDTPFKQKK